jgi:hypothetical protein
MNHTIMHMKEQHRDKIAALEKQSLQQKQQLIRSREADIWEREERHYIERHQMAKRQMKDIFFLQRHQVSRFYAVIAFFCFHFCTTNLLLLFKNLLGFFSFCLFQYFGLVNLSIIMDIFFFLIL